MADLATDGAQVTWVAPQCPFSIEYSTRVLDDIRLAVVDAFFSLPRGGAEIGGILLGTYQPGCLAITSYQASRCEHAAGPSFTLSPNDEAKLREQLASVRGQVVGWYHSHTRSGIFLSEADLDIHQRFFPEPWQIAMVMKPHTFQPVCLGLFFRERDGSIHASAAYQETPLEPLPLRQVPSGEPAFHPAPAVPYSRETENRGPGRMIPGGPTPGAPITGGPINGGPIINLELPNKVPAARSGITTAPEPRPVVVTTPAAVPTTPVPPAPVPSAAVPASAVPAAAEGWPAVEAGPEPSQPPPPSFLVTQPTLSTPWRVILAIGAGLALGAAGFQTREIWLPSLMATVRSMLPSSGPPFFGLNTLDSSGQLQIRWDQNSPPVRTGVAAILEITDGAEPRPQSIPMDPQHLQAGVFTYGRRSEKVEVKLTIRMPDGRDIRQVTTFLGALPPRLASPEDPEVRRQRDQLAQEAVKLKSDLTAQEKRTRKLERSLSDVQKTIQEQELKRQENQEPPK